MTSLRGHHAALILELKIINHETQEIHEKVLFREECYAIQGAVFEVYPQIVYFVFFVVCFAVNK